MRLSLSPHQLVAHWVPGVVAIGILFVPDLSTATFDASYLGQFIHTIGAPAAILTVAVAGFAAGQFLDCFRNLFEEFMCKFCKKHANRLALHREIERPRAKADGRLLFHVLRFWFQHGCGVVYWRRDCSVADVPTSLTTVASCGHWIGIRDLRRRHLYSQKRHRRTYKKPARR